MKQLFMKLLYILIFTFSITIASPILSSKVIYLNDFDASKFPIVKANFIALNDFGDRIYDIDGKLSIIENGIIRNSTTITCPEKETQNPLSTVLTIDRSISMEFNQFIDIAKTAASSYIDLMDEFSSEIAIVGFSDYVVLYSEFINARKTLKDIVKTITLDGGTNYDIAFLDEFAGALTIAEGAKEKKVIIFLTDGVGKGTEDLIVNRALELEAEIYCVTIGMPAPKVLKNISKRTGGEFFENIKTEEDIEKVYKIIYNLAREDESCEITWRSDGCTQGRVGQILFDDAYSDFFRYDANVEKLAQFEYFPSLYFVFNESSSSSKLITVKAINNEIVIDDIINDNSNFRVISKDKMDFPIIISEGENYTFRIEFIGNQDNFNFSTFEIIGSSCLNNKFYVAAGSQKKTPIGNNLMIKLPNGGDTFIRGMDTVITWKGNLPDDKVLLEFSSDNGLIWSNIDGEHTDFESRWTVPDIISDECKIRISQDSKESGGLYMQRNIDDANVNDIDWQRSGTYVAIACSDSTVRRINTVTNDTTILHREHKTGVTSVSWGPLGIRLISSDSTGRIIMWNTMTNSIENEFQDETIVNVVRWASDNTFIASGGEDGKIRIRSITGNLMNTLTGEHTRGISDLRWYDSGKEFDLGDMLVSSAKDSVVVVWENRFFRRIARFDGYHLHEVSGVRFSPDGRYVVSVARDHSFAIWDISNPIIPIYEDKKHTGPAMDVEWLARDNIIVSAGVDGDVIVRKFTNQFRDMEIIYEYDGIWTKSALSSSPDGSRFVAGLWGGLKVDGDLRFYSVDTFTFMQDESDSLFSIIDFNLSGKIIEMGTAIVGDVKDSMIFDYVQLESILPVNIDSVRIENDIFEVFQSNSEDNVLLEESSTFNLQISFLPKQARKYEAEIAVYTSLTTFRYDLTGEGVEAYIGDNTVDFGEVLVNTSKIENFSIENKLETTILIDSIRQVGPDYQQLEYKGNLNSFQLQKGESNKSFPIRFAPNKTGKVNTFIKIYYNGPGSPALIRVLGTGVEPIISADDFVFDDVKCNQSNKSILTILNTGYGSLIIDKISIIGDDEKYFKYEVLENKNENNNNYAVKTNDGLNLSITFTPNNSREYNAQIQVLSNAVNEKDYRINLSAKKLKTSFNFDDNNFDFVINSENQSGTITLKLINTGESELNWNLNFPIQISPKFILHSITPNPTKINNSSDIVVEFTGGLGGEEFNEVYKLIDECGGEAIINLNAQVLKNTPILLGEENITFEDLICGTSQTYSLQLRSEISESFINKIYFSNFQDKFSFEKDFESIKKGENNNIKIIFNSDDYGAFNTDLIIEYSNYENIISSTFKAAINVIKYDVNYEINYKNSEKIILLEISSIGGDAVGNFTLVNTGNYDLDWTDYKNIDDIQIISINPIVTRPNESSTFTLSLKNPILDTSSYNFNGICEIIKEIEIGVFTNLIYASFQIPNIDVNIGDEFNLPIYLKNSSNLAEINSFNYTLKYNPTLMYPIAGNEIINKRIGEIDFSIKIEDLVNKKNGLLFKALWGNDSTTIMEFVNIEAIGTNKNLDYIQSKGLLRILDLCQADGTRLLKYNGDLTKLENIYPNPISGIGNIEFNLNEESFVEISLFNSIGEEVDKLISGTKSKGTNNIKFESTRYKNGLYFYQLRIKHKIITKKIIISN